MQINANDTIAGIPMLEIRGMMRHAHNMLVGLDLWFFASALHVSQKKAREVVTELERQGYLEIISKRPKEWKTTIKGGSLANAKAAKPIRRATADRVLKAFMERVHEVNTNDYYLHK